MTVGSHCRPVKQTLKGKARRFSPNSYWYRWSQLLAPRYKDGDAWKSYDDNDVYNLVIVPTHYAQEPHDFDVPGPNQEETTICKGHDNDGPRKWGSCMFEDHMEAGGNPDVGAPKSYFYFNSGGNPGGSRADKVAEGTTDDGDARTREFFGR
ncbi:MAG: hypothetical protein WAO61_06865 [Solirubrobacterales bacterium]